MQRIMGIFTISVGFKPLPLLLCLGSMLLLSLIFLILFVLVVQYCYQLDLLKWSVPRVKFGFKERYHLKFHTIAKEFSMTQRSLLSLRPMSATGKVAFCLSLPTLCLYLPLDNGEVLCPNDFKV